MMSKTKFTKGEWSICVRKGLNNGYIDIESSEGDIICLFDFCKRAEQRKVADAHLIAAAPEMYEMLASIKTLIEWGYSASEAMEEMQKITSEITKLLAKARGEK